MQLRKEAWNFFDRFDDSNFSCTVGFSSSDTRHTCQGLSIGQQIHRLFNRMCSHRNHPPTCDPKIASLPIFLVTNSPIPCIFRFVTRKAISRGESFLLTATTLRHLRKYQAFKRFPLTSVIKGKAHLRLNLRNWLWPVIGRKRITYFINDSIV